METYAHAIAHAHARVRWAPPVLAPYEAQRVGVQPRKPAPTMPAWERTCERAHEESARSAAWLSGKRARDANGLRGHGQQLPRRMAAAAASARARSGHRQLPTAAVNRRCSCEGARARKGRCSTGMRPSRLNSAAAADRARGRATARRRLHAAAAAQALSRPQPSPTTHAPQVAQALRALARAAWRPWL